MTEETNGPAHGGTNGLNVGSVVDRAVAGARRVKRQVRKLRVLLTPTSAKQCGTCSAFDPSAVDEVLQRHPAFATAAQWLEPEAMAGPVNELEDAAEVEAPEVIKWSDAGVCARHKELRFKSDGCSHWAPQ